MKKKVLFLVDDYHSGGVTTYIRNQALLLEENNFSTYIVGFSDKIDALIFFKKSNKVTVSKSNYPK